MDVAPNKLIVRSVWNLPYFFFTAGAVLFTCYIHEFTHWTVARFLGERIYISMDINHLVNHVYGQEWHKTPILLAGTAISIIQSVWIFYVMKREKDTVLYPLLLAPVIMRVIACILNFVHPNDEGIISNKLGLGLFTLPILTCVFLIGLVLNLSVSYKLSSKFMAQIVTLVLIFVSFLISIDLFVKAG